ncbi:unnamed protein product [marine sediment metagenome]|uniref:Uncharacterized protein n=1 Tax=marine sediment metagenome TaxID=412755 RepID=X1BYZ4_9ZZZZ
MSLISDKIEDKLLILVFGNSFCLEQNEQALGHPLLIITLATL